VTSKSILSLILSFLTTADLA